MKIDQFTQQIENIQLNDEHDLAKLESLCATWHDIEAMNPLFLVLEKYPDFDFGKPGNVVKSIEKYFVNDKDEYLRSLYASIRRKAVPYTLWMLNRAINGLSNEQEIQEGIDMLQEVSETKQDEELKRQAQHYLEYQESKKTA